MGALFILTLVIFQVSFNNAALTCIRENFVSTRSGGCYWYFADKICTNESLIIDKFDDMLSEAQCSDKCREHPDCTNFFFTATSDVRNCFIAEDCDGFTDASYKKFKIDRRCNGEDAAFFFHQDNLHRPEVIVETNFVQFTLCLWVYVSGNVSMSGLVHILFPDNRFECDAVWIYISGNRLYVQLQNVELTLANSFIEANSPGWTHICFIAGTSGFTWYKDGALAGSDTYDFVYTGFSGEARLVLGGFFWSQVEGCVPAVEHNFYGRISQVYVFKKELTTGEVGDIFNGNISVEPHIDWKSFKGQETVDVPSISFDYRLLGCFDAYNIEPSSDLTFPLDVFVGVMSKEVCIAHCGCAGRSYAGMDMATSHCYCGSLLPTQCGSGSVKCVLLYKTDGITKLPMTLPMKIGLFEPFNITFPELPHLSLYGISYGGRFSEFRSKEVQIALSAVGSQIVFSETEAHWGCKGFEATITVYAPTDLNLVCPEVYDTEQDFECYLDIMSGEGLQSLIWQKDGVEVTTVPQLHSDPMLYHVGDYMKVDRFNPPKPSYPYTRNENYAFININHQFTSWGYLRAFEAHIIRPGGIIFMILRPACAEMDVKYCNTKKSCVNLNEECGDADNLMEFVGSIEKPVFCAESETFMEQGQHICPKLVAITKPQADYKIEFLATFYTEHTGSIVFPVRDIYTVEPGYVLGWRPTDNNPGDIGSYPTKYQHQDFHPVYIYPNHSPVLGRYYSRKLPWASTSAVMHYIRAYVFAATRYRHLFQGDTAGTDLEVRAKVSGLHVSEKVAVTKVYVASIITSFRISLVDYVIDAGMHATVLFHIAQKKQGDTSVTYCIFWDGGTYTVSCDNSTSSTSASKFFDQPGRYIIHVVARNGISNANDSVELFVRGELHWFRWTFPDTKIAPVRTFQPWFASFEANGTGEFNLTYQIGNEEPVSVKLWLTPFFRFNYSHSYSVPTTAYCTFKLHAPLANNMPMEETLGAYSRTLNPVQSLNGYNNIAGLTNRTVVVDLSSNNGTNVTYTIDWGDGNVDTSENVTSLNHAYKSYGNFSTSLTATNLVSSEAISFVIRIDDEVRGLKFINEKIKTSYGNVTDIVFSLKQGTGMDLVIDYGDGHQSTLAHDIDQRGVLTLACGKHLYSHAGYYNVSVFAYNAKSRLEIWQIVSVEEAIEGLDVTYMQEDPHSGYIEVEENLYFTVTIERGMSVMVNYSLGDGAEYISPNFMFTHSYATFNVDPGFTVDITAFNNVSSFTQTIVIPVEMPVAKITDLHVWADPENSTEEMQIFYDVRSGDYFSCVWTIYDISQQFSIRLETSYEQFNRENYIFLKLDPGIHRISLNCTNRLYAAQVTTHAYSYLPVTEFDLQPYYSCEPGQLLIGRGEFSDIYPMDCQIVLASLNQKGSNVSYIFFYGYANGRDEELFSHIFLANTTFHFYKFPEDTLHKRLVARAHAYNNVSSHEESRSMHLYQRVRNLTIFSDGPGRIFVPVNFTVSAWLIGYESCFTIDWGDGSKPNVFGNTDCADLERYGAYSGIADLKPATSLHSTDGVLSHVFEDVGVFTVTVTGENLVSNVSASTSVKVFDKPCSPPQVFWTSAIGNKLEELDSAPYLRCREFSVLQSTVNNCEKTNEKSYSWGLNLISVKRSAVTGNLMGEVMEKVAVSSKHSHLSVKARSLEYGDYELVLIVCMVGVPDICTLIEGYFQIHPCLLRPIFLWSSGRAIEYDVIGDISAVGSHDPDAENITDVSRLQFEWFCKRSREEWPANLDDLPEVVYPESIPAAGTREEMTTGCYNTFIGRMVDTVNGGQIVQIHTKYMIVGTKYDVLLRISQPGSFRPSQTAVYGLLVISGQAIELIVDCVDNCDRKLNINAQTTLKVSPKYYTGDIFFRWSLYGRQNGQKADILLSDLLASCNSTSLTDIFLVIKPSCLKFGYTYKFVVYAYLPGKTQFAGFAEHAAKLNEAPMPDKSLTSYGCDTTTRSGFALEKVFDLFCIGFIDPDGDDPLQYNFYYIYKDNSVKIATSAAIQSKKFLLPFGVKLLYGVVADALGAVSEPFYVKIEVLEKKVELSDICKIASDVDPREPETYLEVYTKPGNVELPRKAINLRNGLR